MFDNFNQKLVIFQKSINFNIIIMISLEIIVRTNYINVYTFFKFFKSLSLKKLRKKIYIGSIIFVLYRSQFGSRHSERRLTTHLKRHKSCPESLLW